MFRKLLMTAIGALGLAVAGGCDREDGRYPGGRDTTPPPTPPPTTSPVPKDTTPPPPPPDRPEEPK